MRLRVESTLFVGGDSGIGRAVALAYAREGASIVISYLNEHDDAQEIQKAVQESGRECILIVSLVVAMTQRIVFFVSSQVTSVK